MAVIRKTYSVENISIQTSADSVERRLCSMQGVRTASVSIRDHTMTVEYDPDIISESEILQKVRETGYYAYSRDRFTPASPPQHQYPLMKKLGIPFLLCLSGLLIPLTGLPQICFLIPLGILIFFVRSIFFPVPRDQSAIPLIRTAVNLSAAAAALIYGIYFALRNEPDAWQFFFSAGSILFFLYAADVLILKNREDVSGTIRSMKNTLPQTIPVLENHREKQNDVSELKKDQLIVIRPGDTVPADGIVQKGFAVMDESSLTGLDKPAEKSEGSYVYAGSICQKGSVTVKTEKVGSKTALLHLAALAEKTAGDTSFQSPFKSFGKYMFVYMILAAGIALSGWLVSGKTLVPALSASLSVLAGSCLYALALSSEAAVMNTAGQAISEHILFRTAEALELCGKTDTVILDQDGTVTTEDLTITDFIPAENVSESQLEYISYALLSKSDRPFAKAIIRHLRSKSISGIDTDEFARLSMNSRSSIRETRRYSSGTMDEIMERDIDPGPWADLINSLRAEGKRVLIFTEDKKIIGAAAARKNLIPGAEDTIEEFRSQGIRIILFTNGTYDESEYLTELIRPDYVIHRPAGDEKETLAGALDASGSVTAYITSGYPGKLAGMVDIPVRIGARSDFDKEDAGIILTTNRLADYLRAVNLSRILFERIQQLQMITVIYHVFIITAFGFLLPAANIPLLPALSAVCGLLLVIFILTRTKQEIS